MPQGDDPATEGGGEAVGGPAGGDPAMEGGGATGEPAGGDPAVEGGGGEATGEPAGEAAMGACARRRLRKAQLRDERQAQVQEQRREKRLRQRHRKQEARKELLEAMSPEERAEHEEREREAGRARKSELEASLQHAFASGRPRVVINCSFSGAMNAKEKRSLGKQLQLTYSALGERRSPIQLHAASLDEANEAWPQLESFGLPKWLVHVHKESYWEVFAAESRSGRLVVLTPDAEEDLEEVEEGCVYVVGGLVDRTVSKLQSATQARDKGAGCLRRLPIKKYGPPGANPVLNIDTVVKILAERLRRGAGSSWWDILVDCLPSRRSGQPTAHMRRKQQRHHLRHVDAHAGQDTGPGVAGGGDHCASPFSSSSSSTGADSGEDICRE